MFSLLSRKIRYYRTERNNNATAVSLIETAIDTVQQTGTLLAWAQIVDKLYTDLNNIRYARSISDRLRVGSIVLYIGNLINTSEQRTLTNAELDFAKHSILTDLMKIVDNRFS